MEWLIIQNYLIILWNDYCFNYYHRGLFIFESHVHTGFWNREFMCVSTWKITGLNSGG